MWWSIRTLRSIPRIKDIAWILGKHGFHQVASALRSPIASRFRRFLKADSVHPMGQPERLRMALEDLGPTFVKFGQLLSTRPDLLPPEYVEELGRLQDNVRPALFSEVEAVLEESFPQGWRRCFREIDPVPIAAASIAQVHRAVTANGDEAVVKVQRRGLARIIRQDIQVLRLLAELLADWGELRLFDPEGIVGLFERSIHRELNFDHERQNLLRMRACLPADSLLRIPAPYPELCTSTVLTMEHLRGETLTRLRGQPLESGAGERLATTVVVYTLRQIFEHGLYHADPHPGNFLLLDDGRLGLLDFGIVGRLTQEMVDDLFLLLTALLSRDFRQVARWVLKRGRAKLDTDVNALSLELMDALDPHYGLRLQEIQIGGLFQSLFSMMFRHGISLTSEYVLVGRAFVHLENVVRLLSPGLDVIPAIQPYMTEAFRRRWAPDRLLRALRHEAGDVLGAIRSSPMNLADLLSRAAEGRLRVQSSIPELSQLERKLDLSSSRVQMSLLTCGLLISSALLLLQQGGEGTLKNALGMGGFLVGLLLALRAGFGR